MLCTPANTDGITCLKQPTCNARGFTPSVIVHKVILGSILQFQAFRVMLEITDFECKWFVIYFFLLLLLF